MYKIKESIIVEGTYDKIKLSRFIDGIIFVTGGFSVIHNEKKLAVIKKLAEETGVVILTDSDSAGFRIRNYIKQLLPECQVKHAYIPDVHGKEKRKSAPGKEGLLGVEGIQDEIILNALKAAGCTIDGNHSVPPAGSRITKADLYASGLSGRPDSARKRGAYTDYLGLPMKISSNMLLDVLNRLMSKEEFMQSITDFEEAVD